MRIAKIVKSNSHIDYIGRVLDRLDSLEPPSPLDYRFGQFVSITDDTSNMIGVIYNSQIINPEYGRLGPRLSSSMEMNAVFSPDLVNEQGILIGILLVGWVDADETLRQGVPRAVLQVNSEVSLMDDRKVRAFHTGANGRLALRYYSQVLTHAKQFAPQLLLAVLEQLESLFGSEAGAELAVLKRTLNWQLVFQNKSL
ncbi:MAG TPA: hypothetical protein VNH22_03105 [Blastocatellia bacterium]|jgi:hypothetical protein|nr:hypothetical protein [Blastocatellia bacterium]